MSGNGRFSDGEKSSGSIRGIVYFLIVLIISIIWIILCLFSVISVLVRLIIVFLYLFTL